jgi:hypothetical protein
MKKLTLTVYCPEGGCSIDRTLPVHMIETLMAESEGKMI